MQQPPQSSGQTPVEAPARTYSSATIAVDWYPERCIHSENCIRGLPRVFDSGRRPWITPDEAGADAIAETVQQCPSGALQFRRLDGGSREPIPEVTEIVAVPNGPLYVRGNIRVEAEDGSLIREGTRVALCRCGRSGHKPFCDNTHRSIDFRAP